MNRQHANMIERIETSGKELLDYIAELPEAEIDRVPAPNEWSIHAVVAHLRDTEHHVFLKRIRRILSEPSPPVVENFDQEEWNREHYSPDEPLKKIASDYRTARRQEVKLLSKTTDKDWSKYAIHPEYGRISIEWIELHNYSHTLEHLHQLLNIRKKQLLKNLNG